MRWIGKAAVLAGATALGFTATTSGTFSLWSDSTTMQAQTTIGGSPQYDLLITADDAEVRNGDVVGWTVTIENTGSAAGSPSIDIHAPGVGSLSTAPWTDPTAGSQLADNGQVDDAWSATWTPGTLNPGDTQTLRFGSDDVTADTGIFAPVIEGPEASNCPASATSPAAECKAPVEVIYDYTNVGTVTGDADGQQVTDSSSWTATVHPNPDEG